MANNIELNITQTKLEQLRCSICKGHLSCAPIRLLPDGSNICGRCTPLDNDVSVYREPALETIFSNATFPCMFKQYGCTTRLLFGRTTEHEANCEYRPVGCAYSLYMPCAWEGSIMQMPDHFTDEHPGLLKQNAEFKFQIDKNEQGILMVVKSNCTFIIKYLYDANTHNLKYDVRSCGSHGEEDFCRIKLMNSLDPDYTVFLKGCKCVLYNHNFFVAENVGALDIKKFLEILNNPVSIKIALILPNYVRNVAGLVDYNLLESEKCSKCRYYLIPPVYSYQQAYICSDCSAICMGCQLTNDKNLVDILFPCRWRGCEVVAKGNAIRSHEIECKYRTYHCMDTNCNIVLNQSKLIEHLQGHNYQYFVDKLTYKTCYSETPDKKYAFTFKKNEIALITYCGGTLNCPRMRNTIMVSINSPTVSKKGNYHSIVVQTSSVNPRQFTAKVNFEHDHCKYVSNTFTINGSMAIYFSELPTCYKENEELSVNLNIA